MTSYLIVLLGLSETTIAEFFAVSIGHPMYSTYGFTTVTSIPIIGIVLLATMGCMIMFYGAISSPGTPRGKK